jgi:hypothetical protein
MIYMLQACNFGVTLTDIFCKKGTVDLLLHFQRCNPFKV